MTGAKDALKIISKLSNKSRGVHRNIGIERFKGKGYKGNGLGGKIKEDNLVDDMFKELENNSKKLSEKEEEKAKAIIKAAEQFEQTDGIEAADWHRNQSHNTLVYSKIMIGLGESTVILTNNSKDINMFIDDMKTDNIVSFDEYLVDNEIIGEKCVVGEINLFNVNDMIKLMQSKDNQVIATVNIGTDDDIIIPIFEKVFDSKNIFDRVIAVDELNEDGIRYIGALK